MKIFIAGGTGFIGQNLVRKLVAEGHSITALIRSAQKSSLFPHEVDFINGSPSTEGPWQQRLADYDVVINLTGHSIFSRWTERTKKLIRDSRIFSTRNIVHALPMHSPKNITFINASAAGYFGFCGDEEKLEDDRPGTDFLAQVCLDWEKEASKAADKGVRVILPRIGIVLGKGGGAMAKMLPAFQLGVAGKIGTGRQWFPWIHLDDLTSAIAFLIKHNEIHGPVNMSAPNPVRNDAFTKSLGRILRRPTILPVPSFLVKLVLGEFGSVVLEGNRMIPGVLKKFSFTFQFPDLESALTDIVRQSHQQGGD